MNEIQIEQRERTLSITWHIFLLPEEEWTRPLDVPLTVALDAGFEDEGVGVEVVVRGDGAILAAAAGVLHHHGHWQGDAAKVLWMGWEQDGRRRSIWSSEPRVRPSGGKVKDSLIIAIKNRLEHRGRFLLKEMKMSK